MVEMDRPSQVLISRVSHYSCQINSNDLLYVF